MRDKFILAIDQGTSATKAMLINNKGKVLYRCDLEHEQYYPNSGWVEHDPKQILNNTQALIFTVVDKSGVNFEDITSLAITNQRETIVVWDKNSGEPVYNAIVWQCNRGRTLCDKLEKEGVGANVKAKTGLVLSPYFSAAKINWVLDNVDGAREKAYRGELLAGTIDSWLIWNLTEGNVHATDFSNASRTQLFNIHELKWDNELLKLFDIPRSIMPKVKSANYIFGYIKKEICGEVKIPIAGVLGDSHAALFAQKCFERGMAKATYGTGSSIMMNIGEKPILSENGIVTSIAWGINDDITYAFEGNINCAGATIKWLIDDLELLKDSAETEDIANSAKTNEGVYFVPAFAGLGAPYWDANAKALISGLTRGSKKAPCCSCST